MNRSMQARAGTTVATVLLADSLLHAYWTTGGFWLARRVATDTPFARLNRAVYTPACLLLCAVAAVVAWPTPTAREPRGSAQE